MVKGILRAWWILSALVAVELFRRWGAGGADLDAVLGALAAINGTVAFVGTAVVGRLNILLGDRNPEKTGAI